MVLDVESLVLPICQSLMVTRNLENWRLLIFLTEEKNKKFFMDSIQQKICRFILVGQK